MSEIYKEKIIDHYKYPRNWGKLTKFTHLGISKNISCGDEISIWMQVDDNDIIKIVGIEGEGCVICLASASILSEILIGKNINKAVKYKKENIVDKLGVKLSEMRTNCVMVSIDAVRYAATKRFAS